MGILLEHYGGNLPTWLAPEQVLVLPIADRHADYAARCCARCARRRGARRDAPVTLHADVDDRGESIGKRIRDAQLQKVPYILVVGDREVEQGAVGVRERGEDKGARPLAEFVDHLVAEVRERRLPDRRDLRTSCVTLRSVSRRGAGHPFALDERFVDVGFAADEELPTAHLLASEPAEGWIAALAIVTVRAEPLPADEWLGRPARAGAGLVRVVVAGGARDAGGAGGGLARRAPGHPRALPAVRRAAPRTSRRRMTPVRSRPRWSSTGRSSSRSAAGCWPWSSWCSRRSAGTRSGRRSSFLFRTLDLI